MSEDSSADTKLTVKVDEEGKLTIDGVEKKIEELKARSIEELVDKALVDKIDFVLEDDGIVGNFFKTIKDGTSADSELRKLYEKTRADNEASDGANSEPSDASESESESEES